MEQLVLRQSCIFGGQRLNLRPWWHALLKKVACHTMIGIQYLGSISLKGKLEHRLRVPVGTAVPLTGRYLPGQYLLTIRGYSPKVVTVREYL